jgi:hypothetical protein
LSEASKRQQPKQDRGPRAPAESSPGLQRRSRGRPAGIRSTEIQRKAKWRTCFNGRGARAGWRRAAPRAAGRTARSRISAASDFGESPEESEQASDESDDDFELRTATSSEDEDTNIPADEDAAELAPAGSLLNENAILRL